MKSVEVYDSTGKEKSKEKLDPRVFSIKKNEVLLKQATLRYLSNLRESTAKTKTRSERRGGGRKPWRQKGTGRARAGTRRSPLWRKGGVIFGPRGLENYTKKMPKKAIKTAILSSLSDKAGKDRILILDKFILEKPKTKKVKELLFKLPVKGRVLFISDKNPIFVKSASNIPFTLVASYNQLNTYDILVADYIVIFKDVLSKIASTYIASLKKETPRRSSSSAGQVEKKDMKKKKEKSNAKPKKEKTSGKKVTKKVSKK